MPRTLKITDGTDEVDLLLITGIIGARGGFGKNSINPDLGFASSPLKDGGTLKSKKYPPKIERYKLNLIGTSQNNVAAQLHALQRILIKADNLQLKAWQQTPVYLQQQATNETGARYALIIAWVSTDLTDWFTHPFEADFDIDNFVIVIAREPLWRGTVPGTLSSLEALKAPDFPYFDSETIGSGGAIVVDNDSALNGDWGAGITLDGASSETFGTILDMDGLTECSFKINFKKDTLVLGSSDEFHFIVANGSGTSGITFVVAIRFLSSIFKARAIAITDAGAQVTTSAYNLSETATNEILVEWKASTGPGNDDGELIFSIDGDPKETLSNIDNDGHDVDDVDAGGVANVDASTEGQFRIDDIQYDDASPFVAAVRTIDFEVTTQFIANYRQTTVLSHIFNEDNNLAAFSANLVAESAFEYFTVSGSTAALDDAVYFGADNPFFNVVCNTKTIGRGNITVFFEYWDGATWTLIPKGSKSADWFSVGTQTTLTMLSFEGASDWATRTINGVASKYWLRLRIETFVSVTTEPVQGDQLVYVVNDCYYEIGDTQIHGDYTALIYNKFMAFGVSPGTDITWMAIGAKSRGLGTFTSRLNADQNPTNWSETFDTDTTQVVDPTAPAGAVAQCTFTGNQTLVKRFGLVHSNNVSVIDWAGSYRVFMRCKQSNGAAGDVSVQLQYGTIVTNLGETIALKQTDAGIEIVDLGQISIFNEEIKSNETYAAGLFFNIFAKSDNGTTPNLDIYDLIFIPIDEFSLISLWAGRTAQDINLEDGLIIDSGLQRQQALHFRDLTPSPIFPLSTWIVQGSLPELEPRRQTRIYFFFGGENTSTKVIESEMGQAGAINLYVHERWFSLKGAD